VRARLRRLIHAFLHLDDTPPRIAAAFGVGVSLAFHPLVGLHTLMALGIAFAFRLSRAAVLVGLYINNPWTMAPMYIAGTTLGCWLLGVPLEGLRDIDWDNWDERGFYRILLLSLKPYLWPYVLGNTILGVVCGSIAYVALRWFLERRARRAAAVRP
jgi:uncharacterized protein (DUF2062 family)